MAPSFFTPQCIRPGKGPTSFVPQDVCQCCEGGGDGDGAVRVVMGEVSAVRVEGVLTVLWHGGKWGEVLCDQGCIDAVVL